MNSFCSTQPQITYCKNVISRIFHGLAQFSCCTKESILILVYLLLGSLPNTQCHYIYTSISLSTIACKYNSTMHQISLLFPINNLPHVLHTWRFLDASLSCSLTPSLLNITCPASKKFLTCSCINRKGAHH